MKNINSRPAILPVKRIVIKIGSSSVIGASGIRKEFLNNLADDIHNLVKSNFQVILVSSGAVAMGHLELDWKVPFNKLSIPERQALAAVGQGILIEKYRRIFHKYKIHIGQILLSAGDMHRRDSFLHLRNAAETLLKAGILPVLNENDSVAVEELLFGDNDTLAAHVAILVQADLLILLSDVDGLMAENNRVAWVPKISREIFDIVLSSKSPLGKGGMNAKIKAAHLLMKCGKKTIISSYKKRGIVQEVLTNRDIGTLFYDPAIEDNWKGKRRWIALGRHPKGKILVDDGAVEKLTKKGSSLLAKGIIGIEGHFEMGDLVEITGSKGTFAQGLTHFSSKDLEKIQGIHSSEFFQILGRSTFQTVVHRNNLVLIN